MATKRISQKAVPVNSCDYVWDSVKCDFLDAVRFSCKPDPNVFLKVAVGTVIDEEKSVRWNREEVDRLRAEYDREVARLNDVKNSMREEAKDKVLALISHETGLSYKKADILWTFVCRRFDYDYSDIFDGIDDYIELVCTLLDK